MTATTTAPAAAPVGVRIFGREPAVLLGLIEAALALLVVLAGDQLGLTPDFTVYALAAVSAGLGVWSALATRDALLGVGVGFVKAALGLAAYFGLELDLEAQAALVAFVAAGIGFWQRTQTSPVADPVDRSPVQVTASPLQLDPGAALTVDAGGPLPGGVDELHNTTGAAELLAGSPGCWGLDAVYDAGDGSQGPGRGTEG